MIKDLEQLLEVDIPFSSFLGKGKGTMEILELCAEENERRIAREYWTTDTEGYGCYKGHRIGDVEGQFKK